MIFDFEFYNSPVIVGFCSIGFFNVYLVWGSFGVNRFLCRAFLWIVVIEGISFAS